MHFYAPTKILKNLFCNVSFLITLCIGLCSFSTYILGRHIGETSLDCATSTERSTYIKKLEANNILQNIKIKKMDSLCEQKYKDLHGYICDKRVDIVEQELKTCRRRLH